MKKSFKNRKALVAAACYGLAVLVWLGLSLAAFVIDSAWPPRELDLDKAILVNLTRLEGGSYHTENVDPQIIFEDFGNAGTANRVRTVQLRATFRYGPGELELFPLLGEAPEGVEAKSGAAELGFDARSRVIGVPQDDGSVLFTLPPGTVRALRLDPGTAGDNIITIESVTLNPWFSAGHYFIPSLRQVMALVLLPALALCTIYFILDFFPGKGNPLSGNRGSTAATLPTGQPK